MRLEVLFAQSTVSVSTAEVGTSELPRRCASARMFRHGGSVATRSCDCQEGWAKYGIYVNIKLLGLSTSLGGRFWCLITATFLGFLGFGAVLPGLAPHLHRDLGASDRVVGFVIGTFSVIALCSRPFVGRLADRKGRKRAFLTGLCSCTLAGGAYLLPLGVGAMYLGRALQGLGEACLYTGAAAWAVELAGVHRTPARWDM